MNKIELQEKLRDIKASFRLYMNGAVSQSMREKGIHYKVNFGIDLPRLKEIAASHSKDHELAQALWKEEIRECKILAGMLQPIETFFSEIADIWLDNMQYAELAELTTMNLFQYLPYAPSKCFEWIADERELAQMCGFLLAARLFMQGLELNERAENEFLDQAQVIIESSAYHPRKAAILSLKKYGAHSGQNAKRIIQLVKGWQKGHNNELKQIGNEIKTELDYLL